MQQGVLIDGIKRMKCSTLSCAVHTNQAAGAENSTIHYENENTTFKSGF